ncbi:hypothetical protein M2454_000193 [Aequitasia blattaphilus]|uniref:Peptidase C39-like domain-containing protein n=1 Tax=Aequitasia blattaphilus TaxID=2949332 RepID=A0ABT1E5W8_9FIRM|nr:hypothetical protein [Aequitasia blattaphilus]MCP1100974.1 hypothetical protein [Aequitasia blattaphilus]MCR8613614.1 hypothetical protein [Aequitasia blattaphilus]
MNDIETTLSKIITINQPELLHIKDGEEISYGAHQIWYSSWLQRMSGCGPTAAANLLWYLAETRSLGKNLFKGDGTNRQEMTQLMEAVWRYVTPGWRGVDKASTFAKGVTRYGKDHGVRIKTHVLEISGEYFTRTDPDTVWKFLRKSFEGDCPVAFLNLSNGAVENLDNWHWVTLVGANASLIGEMYDQGRHQQVDIKRWLDTTTGGGAFVSLEMTDRKRRD